MQPHFSRDAVLAVISLGLVVVFIDVLAGNKTQARTYNAADCATAYRYARTRGDTLTIDRHMYSLGGHIRQHCANTRFATR